MLALGSRRLHDIGISGWWQLLILVPGIGWAALAGLATIKSRPETNDFGPPPEHLDPGSATASFGPFQSSAAPKRERVVDAGNREDPEGSGPRLVEDWVKIVFVPYVGAIKRYFDLGMIYL